MPITIDQVIIERKDDRGDIHEVPPASSPYRGVRAFFRFARMSTNPSGRFIRYPRRVTEVTTATTAHGGTPRKLGSAVIIGFLDATRLGRSNCFAAHTHDADCGDFAGCVACAGGGPADLPDASESETKT